MHLDDDLLALIALGEDAGTADDLRHIGDCPRCRDELAALREVVAVVRSLAGDDELIDPPPAVWDRIRAETHGPAGPTTVRADATVPPPVEDAPRPALAEPVVLARPHRRIPALLLAAALAFVLGLGVGPAWRAVTGPRVQELARTTLAPVNAGPATGVAYLEQTGPTRDLVVQVESGVPGDGRLEVWLIAPDQSGMTSLGFLDGSSGRLVVPADLDVAAFPLVDVSIEPTADADPTHSGTSLLRGQLPA